MTILIVKIFIVYLSFVLVLESTYCLQLINNELINFVGVSQESGSLVAFKTIRAQFGHTGRGRKQVSGAFRLKTAPKEILSLSATSEVEGINSSLCESGSVICKRFQEAKKKLFDPFYGMSSSENAPKSLYVVENKDSYNSANQNIANMNLVRIGKAFESIPKLGEQNIVALLQSTLDKVPGCVATVHVKTTLTERKETKILDLNSRRECASDVKDLASRYDVHIDGTADAMLSRGLVALISTTLSSSSQGFERILGSVSDERELTAQDVLNIESDIVADLLGLRNTLSKGRNDGLANIIRLIQKQIKVLLGHDEEASLLQNSTETENSTLVKEDNQQYTHVKRKSKVAMLLSGGVDSSVALNLLARDENYEVHAYYLKIWLEDEMAHLGQCPWEDDWDMCQQVVQSLKDKTGIHVPLEAIGLQNEYRENIIRYTLEEALKGRTPNPDIMCNARVKFGCFYDAIANRGYDFIATGHYADVRRSSSDTTQETLTKLHRAPDPIKDQSYFLSALTQEQLSRVLFPLGELHKTQVREIAENFDLPNKKRPDSQGLCFLGKVKFDDFLGAYLEEDPGDIVNASTGEVIGKHKGIWYHTVGQVRETVFLL